MVLRMSWGHSALPAALQQEQSAPPMPASSLGVPAPTAGSREPYTYEPSQDAARTSGAAAALRRP